jgi:formate hydrogenlyase transcriptional activator
MPDAVVLVDGRGRGVRANRQFVRMFGYSQEEIVDADLSSLIIPPESREEAHILAASKPRQGTAATQSVCIRKGGERFQISLVEGPLLTGKPASRYMICRELVLKPEVKGTGADCLRERLELESREKDRLRLLLDLNNCTFKISTLYSVFSHARFSASNIILVQR